MVPTEGVRLDAGELLGFLGTRLARFKLPKDIEIVEELPHHVTGKVLRRMLRNENE